MNVLGNNRLGNLVPTRHHGRQKIDHFSSLAFIGIEKVNPFMGWFDAKSGFMCFVFQNQLLQVIKGLLVVCLLSHLYLRKNKVVCQLLLEIKKMKSYICFPEVFSFNTVAIRAELSIHHKVNNKHLLQDSSTHYFCLDGQFDLDPLRVGFGPNKTCINKPDSVQAF